MWGIRIKMFGVWRPIRELEGESLIFKSEEEAVGYSNKWHPDLVLKPGQVAHPEGIVAEPIELKEDNGCRHEFTDTKYCVFCGWIPPKRGHA